MDLTGGQMKGVMSRLDCVAGALANAAARLDTGANNRLALRSVGEA
jgi:hypothetical protein